MKPFKKFVSESMLKNDVSRFVRVVNGRIELRSTSTGGPLATFGSDIFTAVIQGDEIVATKRTGETYIWKLNSSKRGVIGPIRVIS